MIGQVVLQLYVSAKAFLKHEAEEVFESGRMSWEKDAKLTASSFLAEQPRQRFDTGTAALSQVRP